MQAIKNPLVLAIPVVGSFEKHSPAICMVNFSQKEIHRPKHQFSGANLLLVFREGMYIYIYIYVYIFVFAPITPHKKRPTEVCAL